MADNYYSIPSWYRTEALKPATDSSSFLRVANAVLPYYDAADRRNVATFLGADPSGLFKDYLGASLMNMTPTTPPADTVNRQFYLSADRARDAINRLESMRTSQGLSADQLGPGYKFLTQAIDLLSRFGINQAAGEQSLTRAEYEQLQSQLTALTSQAQSDKSLAPYAELASKFINPTVLGEFMPTSTVSGQTVYGAANKRLFT